MTDVFLVDDHAVLRAGLRELLRREPDMRVIGEASSGREALDALEVASADVLVTDHSMPGMDGLELVRHLRGIQPELRVVVLTMHDELHLYREMNDAGVDGYILKKDTESDLAAAVRAAASGERYVSDTIRSALDRKDPMDAAPLLTPREREITQLIVREMTNDEIADHLCISKYTVETHRKNIFRKTGADSLVGLINFAHKNGLVGS